MVSNVLLVAVWYETYCESRDGTDYLENQEAAASVTAFRWMRCKYDMYDPSCNVVAWSGIFTTCNGKEVLARQMFRARRCERTSNSAFSGL
ncbi:hypothetical protein BDQ12DRAFT_688470 [Crucibulum laeve]|uniref:Uncharacterized protein n=1 Tax=Crucibulum laeve TaxID=68775 RepID=A0A5C3LQW4_9AGAR|nr:hypothetical protein BDQ12DRAFT_688470 [Crucibulum laeve]